MGIHELGKLLSKYCLEEKKNLKDFHGFRVGIDVSIYLHKFCKPGYAKKVVFWLDRFIELLCGMRKHGIKPICFFDGPNPPPEKKLTQEKRRATTERIKHQIKSAEVMINTLKTKYLGTHVMIDEDTIETIRSILGTTPLRDGVNYNIIEQVIETLEQHVAKKVSQTTSISPNLSVDLKEMLDVLGLPYIQADGEAEKESSLYCKLGYIDAVLTEDTDVLAYGAPVMMSDIQVYQGTVKIRYVSAIMKHLELEYEEFLDFCIMCKCDYNERIKKLKGKGTGSGYGVTNCLKLIKIHRRLETVEENLPTGVSAACLNYRRCRELFSFNDEDMERIEEISTMKKIDLKELNKFLKKYEMKTKKEYILDSFKTTKVKIFKKMTPDIEE